MVKHTHWYEYMEVVMGYSSELMVIIYTKIVESYQVILFMDPEKNSDRLRSIWEGPQVYKIWCWKQRYPWMWRSKIWLQRLLYPAYCFLKCWGNINSTFIIISPTRCLKITLNLFFLLFFEQDDMLIAQDEIFGPVQSILKFKWAIMLQTNVHCISFQF